MPTLDATARSDTALAVHRLLKRFGGVTAVNGVSFSVRPAEILGIIGPNGSGKSTLFNLISGIEAADAGSVHLMGRDVTRLPAWRIARAGLGRTFQIPSLFANMSVWDNLMAAAVEADWGGAPDRAEMTLELLQIAEVRDNLASELSGGQQKLVEFARVCMRGPQVVLLDEVTAGVHPNIRRIILQAVRRFKQEGVTFLVIEHDMELVREICERVIVMDFGEIVAEGSFAEIAADRSVQQAYLGRQA